MADTGFLSKEKLKDFLEALAKDAALYAPCSNGEIVLFEKYSQIEKLCLDRPANIGPKSVLYPQCETLLSFDFKKNNLDDPKKVDIEVKAETNDSKTIIFGCRPCDAKGFSDLRQGVYGH